MLQFYLQLVMTRRLASQRLPNRFCYTVSDKTDSCLLLTVRNAGLVKLELHKVDNGRPTFVLIASKSSDFALKDKVFGLLAPIPISTT